MGPPRLLKKTWWQKKQAIGMLLQADLSTFQFLTLSLNGKKVWLHRPSTCFRLSHVQDKLNIPYRGLPWGNSTLNEFARTVGPSFPPSSIVRNSLACTMRTRWRQMLPALDLDDDPCLYLTGTAHQIWKEACLHKFTFWFFDTCGLTFQSYALAIRDTILKELRVNFGDQEFFDVKISIYSGIHMFHLNMVTMTTSGTGHPMHKSRMP